MEMAISCRVFSCAAILFTFLQNTLARTIFVSTGDCFGLPESPISVDGAVVTNTAVSGQTLCYFQPADTAQYLNIRIDSLTMERKFGACPTLSLQEYSSVRQEFIDDTDPYLRATMSVPVDLRPLLQANCSDYQSKIGQIARTSSPGLKLQMDYKPGSSTLDGVLYKFTISSFVFGPSFNCPEQTFRCWSERTTCIPESLTCDRVNNCNDDSDENNYVCTGRINGIPLPLFAIIIVVSFILLVLLVTFVVFCLRHRKQKKHKEEQKWVDMTMRPLPSTHEPLLPHQNQGPSA